MRLLNLDGEPFVFNNKDSVVMYEGRRTQPLAYFTGFTLLEETMPWRFLRKHRLAHYVCRQ